MNKKSVLITNFEIKQFSGSEINVLSIAERFENLGYKVYIAALNFDEPLFSRINKEDYTFINIVKDEFHFKDIEFDIVWSQHSFVLEWLIFEKELQAKKIIISSLSPFEAFESIPEYSDDLNIILANSIETKTKLEEEGFSNIYLFENSAHERFFNKENNVTKLNKIAMISNHEPDEIVKAKKIFEERNYQVDVYGLAGIKTLIDENVLSNYDLVISIGKTVQFCMALRIPIYVYDRFGGPGYINKNNLDLNRTYNFSGRNFDKKTPEELVDDVIQNFDDSLKNIEYFHEYALNNFCFEKNIDEIIEKVLNDKKDIDLGNIRYKYQNRIRNKLVYSRLYNYSFYTGYEKGRNDEKEVNRNELELYKSDNAILKSELKKVENENFKHIEEIKELNSKLQQIYNSKTWRYTKVFRVNKNKV